jgi:hypothetical protein
MGSLSNFCVVSDLETEYGVFHSNAGPVLALSGIRIRRYRFNFRLFSGCSGGLRFRRVEVAMAIRTLFVPFAKAGHALWFFFIFASALLLLLPLHIPQAM